jgi:pimeloyl-ACP methyl ester carboxylesterase
MKYQKLALPAPFDSIELGYVEHGAPDAARTVVCVHGLTRNARDFDLLAQDLAAHGTRVLAVDMVGRGGSSWLADPGLYVVPTYAAHMKAFLALLGQTRVDWVGTSMGGLIGMRLAAEPETAIERLVLNDIGPFVPQAALAGIGLYLGLDLVFPDLLAPWPGTAPAAPRKAGACTTTRQSGHPMPARSWRTSTCGRSTTPYAARPWFCVAPRARCCCPRPPRRWKAVAPAQQSSPSRRRVTRRLSRVPARSRRSGPGSASEGAVPAAGK